MDKASFYMVFVEGGNSPIYRHENYGSALTEAKRLAKVSGRKAFVLMSITEVEINEFVISNMVDASGELPF